MFSATEDQAIQNKPLASCWSARSTSGSCSSMPKAVSIHFVNRGSILARTVFSTRGPRAEPGHGLPVQWRHILLHLLGDTLAELSKPACSRSKPDKLRGLCERLADADLLQCRRRHRAAGWLLHPIPMTPLQCVTDFPSRRDSSRPLAVRVLIQSISRRSQDAGRAEPKDDDVDDDAMLAFVFSTLANCTSARVLIAPLLYPPRPQSEMLAGVHALAFPGPPPKGRPAPRFSSNHIWTVQTYGGDHMYSDGDKGNCNCHCYRQVYRAESPLGLNKRKARPIYTRLIDESPTLASSGRISTPWRAVNANCAAPFNARIAASVSDLITNRAKSARASETVVAAAFQAS